MTISVPYSAHLSEIWLLERTYHAQLRNGMELSVPDLTEAMEQLIDVSNPLSSQSVKSHLAERLPIKKSSNCSVPLSTWKEISQEEARASYQQGVPVLLYGEHAWKHPKGASRAWSVSKNIRVIMYGNALEHPASVSGIDYAVCYLDPLRGAFSNASWKVWFASDTTGFFDGSFPGTITCFVPCVQFPYTTHYTVIASDGQTHEYADRTQALQGFQAMPSREADNGSGAQTVFPQFSYYHEVTCPDGIYRLEFFGPRMHERGYHVQEERRGQIRKEIAHESLPLSLALVHES